MSETKKKPPVTRKVISATTGEEVKPNKNTMPTKSAKPAVVPAEAKSRARGLRITAAVLWVLAILAEVAAILMLTKYIYVSEDSMVMWLIVALAVDLVLVVIGSQLWKKANRIDPASEANKFKFWLWNNLGRDSERDSVCPLHYLAAKRQKPGCENQTAGHHRSRCRDRPRCRHLL
jgi:hypothetical protein